MTLREIRKRGPDRYGSPQLGAPAAAALTVVPPVFPENIGEDKLGIIRTEAVHGHPLVDHRTQSRRRVVSDGHVKARRTPLQ